MTTNQLGISVNHSSVPNSFSISTSVIKTSHFQIATDTITNLTDRAIGMYSTYVLPGSADRVCGRQGQISWVDPANPTVYSSKAQLGIIMLDRVSRVHARAQSNGTLYDDSRIIPPNREIQIQYAVGSFPSYWEFVNAARMLLGQVMHIPGPFAELRYDHGMDLAQLDQFYRMYDPYYLLCYAEQGYHGSDLLDPAHVKTIKDEIAERISIRSGVVNLVYFDCGIIGTAKDAITYPEACVQDMSGSIVYYDGVGKTMPIMLPIGAYAAYVYSNAMQLLDETEADGLYLDMFEYGDNIWSYAAGHVVLDPETGSITSNGEITNLRASNVLVSEAWRVSFVKSLQQMGKAVVINGAPATPLSGALGVVRFAECNRDLDYPTLHLTTPQAYIGWQPSEKAADAAALQAGLQGALAIDPNGIGYTRNKKTIGSLSYPITPTNILAGSVSGPERDISFTSTSVTVEETR